MDAAEPRLEVMRRNQNKNSESHVDFAAIDLLYDPQASRDSWRGFLA